MNHVKSLERVKMKKLIKFIGFLVVVFCLISVINGIKNVFNGDSSSNTSSAEVSSKSISSTSSQSSSSSSIDVSDVNKELLTSLNENQGFATGHADENGEPITDATQYREPNSSFFYSTLINKWELADEHEAHIYVTDQFKQLDKADQTTMANKMALSLYGNLSSYSSDLYEKKPFIIIYHENSTIGRSTILDPQKIKIN